MERRDIHRVTELLQKYLRRFHLAPSMGEEDVAHWLLPQENIIDTFVVEVWAVVANPQANGNSFTALTDCLWWSGFQGAGGVLTDFTSFYTLPSTVMHHPLHRSLKAAYSFYNVHTQTPLLDLMNDALILAKLVLFYHKVLSKKYTWTGIVVFVYFYFVVLFFCRKVLMFLMPWIWWRIKYFWRSLSLALEMEICSITSTTGSVPLWTLIRSVVSA